MRSPTCMPAFSAAEPGETFVSSRPGRARSSSLSFHQIPSRGGGGGVGFSNVFRIASVSRRDRHPERGAVVALGQFPGYVEQQPGDLLHPRGVEQVRVVAGRVIIVVKSGVEHQGRNAVIVKRGVVAAAFDDPGELQAKSQLLVLAADELSQAERGAGSDDGQAVVAEAADHVEVDGHRHLLDGERGMLDPMARPQQALLLTVPQGEHDRTSGAFGQP